MNANDKDRPFEQPRDIPPEVSPEMSVYWKPLYRMFDDGSPIDPVTILLFDLGNEKRLPFAAIAKTRGHRLVLWPPSHAHEPHEFTEGDAVPIHHVTLDLSNGRTHFTRFDPNSGRVHEDREWRLAKLDGGLKHWLIGAFQVRYLEKQVGVVEGNIQVPRTDAIRRENEFRRYVAQLTSVAVATPPLRGDCLLTVMYLVPETGFEGPFDCRHFPMGRFWDDWLQDWPDGDQFQVAASIVPVGNIKLLLLTAAPPGCLRSACFLGCLDQGRHEPRTISD